MTPTDIDRRVAFFFGPSPGMRAWGADGWMRLTEVHFDGDVLRPQRPEAYDTSDPATLGCMRAQNDAMLVEVLRDRGRHDEADRLAASHARNAQGAAAGMVLSMAALGAIASRLPAFKESDKGPKPPWCPTGFYGFNNVNP